MTSSLLISDIAVTKDENSIKRQLMQTYDGIENVTRWYFDLEEDHPMACVQVDFNSSENMKKLLENGVVIDGICRRVSTLKGLQCNRCQQIGHKTHECKMKPLNEQDLMNLFEQQKQRLREVMNRIEVQLNEVITLRTGK